MNKHTPISALLSAPLLALHGAAQAHTGHGLPGTSHWHAQDTALLLLGAVVVAGATWLISRRK